MARRVVTVFGGSGFVGRHLVQRLAAEGWTVRVAVRDPEAAAFLQPLGNMGQIVAMPCSVTNPAAVELALKDAEAAVNLVGILYERGKAKFQTIHVDGARIVAEAAARMGVARLVHMSALGADTDSPSAYARTKAAGEDAVMKAFPGASIIRPSVVFGPEDDFFNRFAVMARSVGVLPVVTGDGLRVVRRDGWFRFDAFGSGGTKFQPVYVGDVAEAIMACLRADTTAGQTYELGGSEVLSMLDVLRMVLRYSERKALLVPLPFWLASLEALWLQFLPKPLLTPDQVKLLRSDNVVGGKLPGLLQLGITPTAPEAVIPSYLRRFKPIDKQAPQRR